MNNNTLTDAVKNQNTKDNNAVTENGMPAYKSSLNRCVDLFYAIGGLRGDNEKATQLFKLAYDENPAVAAKVMLYARDIRGGQGERSLFRAFLDYIENMDQELFVKVIPKVPLVGRWDDLYNRDNYRKRVIPK